MATSEEFERVTRAIEGMSLRERFELFNQLLLQDPAWQAKPLWVYAIRAGDYGGDIKIGISRHPLKRLGQLQTSNPVTLAGLSSWPTVAEEGIEELLHEQYADSRIRGEWFMHSRPLMRLLRDHNSGVHWKAAA